MKLLNEPMFRAFLWIALIIALLNGSLILGAIFAVLLLLRFLKEE